MIQEFPVLVLGGDLHNGYHLSSQSGTGKNGEMTSVHEYLSESNIRSEIWVLYFLICRTSLVHSSFLSSLSQIPSTRSNALNGKTDSIWYSPDN